MRKRLMLTAPCSCVAEIILLLSFSNCSPQPRSPLALLRFHCEKSEKNCGQNYPNLSHFYRLNVLIQDCKWKRWPTLNLSPICFKKGPSWTFQSTNGPISTCHQNLICFNEGEIHSKLIKSMISWIKYHFHLMKPYTFYTIFIVNILKPFSFLVLSSSSKTEMFSWVLDKVSYVQDLICGLMIVLCLVQCCAMFQPKSKYTNRAVLKYK